MDSRELLYSKYINNQDELQKLLKYRSDSNLSHMHFLALSGYLKKLEEDEKVEYKYENDSFEIETGKYKIKLIIIHSSDYCFYTINKKTGRSGNYTRKLKFEAVKNALEMYI